MTLEAKWDLLFPLTSRVAAIVESMDGVATSYHKAQERDRLMDACRELKRAVDAICPDVPSQGTEINS